MTRVILNFCVTVLYAMCVTSRETNRRQYEFMNHRISLLEEGLKTYVYQSGPLVATLQKEIELVKAENKQLQTTVADQQRMVDDLQWATSEVMANTLSREERDLVTELKWTIFDLKNANKELEEEACLQSTECFGWTEWTKCSQACGLGTQIRSRKCEKGGKFSSMCDPLTVQEKACNGSNCVRKLANLALMQFDCQKGYTSFQGFCFRFSGRKDARLLSTIMCEKEDAHLVSIDSDEKHKIVWDYINTVAPEYMADLHEDFSKREYWDTQDIDTKTNVAVDGIRKHQTRHFTSWRGRKMDYFKWAIGQPRNSISDGDYCVTVNVLTGDWYMKCCGVTFFYVCESEFRNRL